MLRTSIRLIAVFFLAFVFHACKKDEVISPVEEKTFTIDPEFEKELFRQNIDNTLNGSIRDSEMKKIESLSLRGLGRIKTLKGIEHFENLKSLSIFDVKIDSLDLSKNAKLEYLYCRTIGIEGGTPSLVYLNVKNCKALRYLDCSYNLLSELDVTGNPALTFLAFSVNHNIKEINLSANVALDTIECSLLPNLTKLDVSKNTRLSTINSQGSSIQSLDLSTLANLKALDVRFSSVSEVKFKNAAFLEELLITGSKVTFPDPAMFSKLKMLYFESGQFSTKLSPLPDLKTLNVSHVNAPAIDLSGNKNLETLTLFESAFTDINLTNNTNLRELALFNLSNLKSLDLSRATNLTSFGSIENKDLKTICVSKIPDPLGLYWHKDEWSTYVICK
ncbi:hypothetical protein [Dyadobacter sp. CY323]|uniref:hypothetical protein n=1 Tax=Dyadobacter sp. CY323 TaxID=2907302 RepID=UPI001F27A1DA|nr:hypothetical protein [Dyadobacter sp. CY323]MCE6991223.1 hypothetical protein [Dyadobacter sp. CY323]